MLLILGALLIIGLIAVVTKNKCFPYPSLWLKALGLAAPNWIGVVAVFSLLFWQFIFLFILAVVDRSPSPAIFLVFAAGVLVASLIWYVLLILLYSLFLRLLWKQVPQFLSWIKPPRIWQAIFFGWAVSTLAALDPALLFLPFTSYSFYSSNRVTEILEKLNHVMITEEAIAKMFSIWYIVAAYLYQARSLLRSRRRWVANRQ